MTAPWRGNHYKVYALLGVEVCGTIQAQENSGHNIVRSSNAMLSMNLQYYKKQVQRTCADFANINVTMNTANFLIEVHTVLRQVVIYGDLPRLKLYMKYLN